MPSPEQQTSMAMIESTVGAIHSWTFSDASRAEVILEGGDILIVDLDGTIEDEQGNAVVL